MSSSKISKSSLSNISSHVWDIALFGAYTWIRQLELWETPLFVENTLEIAHQKFLVCMAIRPVRKCLQKAARRRTSSVVVVAHTSNSTNRSSGIVLMILIVQTAIVVPSRVWVMMMMMIPDYKKKNNNNNNGDPHRFHGPPDGHVDKKKSRTHNNLLLVHRRQYYHWRRTVYHAKLVVTVVLLASGSPATLRHIKIPKVERMSCANKHELKARNEPGVGADHQVLATIILVVYMPPNRRDSSCTLWDFDQKTTAGTCRGV
jgi:hypothetical protein